MLCQQWWHDATTGISGVYPGNERIAEFTTRQLLDIFSPANLLWTNPVVLRATMEQGGENLLRGFGYLLEDLARKPLIVHRFEFESFVVGERVATTPGNVIYRKDSSS